MNVLVIGVGVAKNGVLTGLQTKVFEQGFGNLAPRR